MTDAPYSVGLKERRGAVLGWRAGQALAVALGAVALVAGVGTDSPAGVALGVGAGVLGFVAATMPVRGRGIDEWFPVVVGFVLRVRRGALTTGASVVRDEGGLDHVRWPDGLATVIAELRHHGLRALDDEPAALGESLGTWLRGLGDGSTPRGPVTLLCEAGAIGAPRDANWLGSSGCVVREYVALSGSEPVDVGASLSAAGITGAVNLDASQLDELLGRRVRPAVATLLDCEFVTRWSLLEGPSTVHASFVVEEWPRGRVDEQLLAPLCIARDRRTVAIALTVEERHRARERAARQRTSRTADRAITSAGGFLHSPESDRDDARDGERANELAAGHGSIRAVGMVAIDARDEVELEGAIARLLADATNCGIALRRCNGDHRRGMLASVAGWCTP